MNREAITTFAGQCRAPDDFFYLLVDGQAEARLSHPLSVPSLTQSLGSAAVTRVLRPDMAHSPERCPALIQLAAPGQAVPQHYFELSADYAARHLTHNLRYICGVLVSPQPLEVVAAHIAARCETTACKDGWPSPWYEPLRLELLLGAMGREAGSLLDPVRSWLFPNSWGGHSLLRSTVYPCDSTLPQLAREVQQLAPMVQRFLGLWRHVVQDPPAFSPWCWTGPSVLPPQAGVHAFRLMRDARALGLVNSRDIISLSLHRVLLHPHLPQHPDIQTLIAKTRAGAMDLHSHFATCRDAFWKRVFADLPRAENYS